jgi:hypothetical protein
MLASMPSDNLWSLAVNRSEGSEGGHVLYYCIGVPHVRL